MKPTDSAKPETREIQIIVAHPKPGSFNHAIAEAAAGAARRNGFEVFTRDLYAEGFDPLFTAEELSREYTPPPEILEAGAAVARARGLVFVHPNWWDMPPAILKGWLDRVLRQGEAYEFTEEGPHGLLAARAGVVFNTSNTPQDIEDKVYGDPLEGLWKRVVFGLCGVEKVVRRNYTSVIMSTVEKRRAWLADVEKVITETFPAL